MSKNAQNKLVKIGEAAKILGVSIDTLRRWEKAGKIQTTRTLGGTRLYDVATLSSFTSKHAKSMQKPQVVSVATKNTQPSYTPTPVLFLNQTQEESVIPAYESESMQEISGSRVIAQDDSYILDSGVREQSRTAPENDIRSDIFQASPSNNLTMEQSNNENTFSSKSLLDQIEKSDNLFKPHVTHQSSLPTQNNTPLYTTKKFNFSFKRIIVTGWLLTLVLGAFLGIKTYPNISKDINKQLQSSDPEKQALQKQVYQLAGTLENLQQKLFNEQADPKRNNDIKLSKKLSFDTSSAVLAASTSASYLEINSDVNIVGNVFAQNLINGLNLGVTQTGFTIAGGQQYANLNVSGNVTLNQNLSTTSSPTFSALTLSSTTNQITSNGNNFTLPSTSDTLAGIAATQTFTNKSISGSQNTLTNIPNSALVNNNITINAGSGMSGGGTVQLGGSISLSVDTGDFVTLDGTQTLTNKTLTSPIINTPTIDVGDDETGDVYYRNSDGEFTRLGIGSTNQVLSVVAGIPSWQSISGSCTNCVLTDPSTTQTITPTAAGAIGLSIAQAAGGTVDIFNVTNNAGSTKYIQVNSSGNVGIGGTASIQRTLDVNGDIALGIAGAYTLRSSSGTIVNALYNSGSDEIRIGAVDNGTGLSTSLYSSGSRVMTLATSGNVGIGDTSPTALLTVGSSDAFQVNSSGAIAAATGITSSGTITFSGLTAGSGVYTTTGGQLTTTPPSSGTLGFWSRSGTTLSPSNSGDAINTSGNITGNRITSTDNFALPSGGRLYWSSDFSKSIRYSDGVGFAISGGNVGIMSSAPDKVLEINSATGANLRLTYNDSDGSATNYTDFSLASDGDLTIAPSGGAANITGLTTISSLLQVGSATATTYSRFGTASTGHSLSGASSILVSGDLEIDGTTYFDGNVNTTNLVNTGTFTTSGGAANINVTGTDLTNIGNSTGALTLASGSTSSWTNTSGNLTISTATSGTLALSSAGVLNLTSALAAGQTTNSSFNITNSNDLGASDELLQVGDSGGTFITVVGTGNVGIGTTTPATLTLINGIAIKPQLNTVTNLTDDNSNRYAAITGDLVLNNTSNNSQSRYGVFGVVETATANSQNSTGSLRGSQGWIYHNGSGALTRTLGGTFASENVNAGTITTAYGVSGGVNNDSNGTIASAVGLGASIGNTSSGTITTAYGIAVGGVESFNNWSNGGTITTSYGIYLGSDIDVGVTKYALYSASTSNSFLTGNLGIADASPTNALTVTGVGSISSYLQVGSETATTYSRFGTGSTGHSLSGAADLLLSDDLEVDGQIYADGITSGTPSGSVCYDSSNKLIQCSGGSSLTGSGTSGQIAFFNGTNSITSETSGFGWDTTNKLFTITSTATTQTVASISDTSLTTGELLDLTGTYVPTDGSTNEAIDINITNNPSSSANTLQGINLSLTDATALANTLYGTYSTVDNSSNTATGTHSIYGGYFTAAGKTAGTTTAVGLYASASGADSNYAGIFENGNVGIGTTTPTATNKLDVVATSGIAISGATTISSGTTASRGVYGGLTHNTSGTLATAYGTFGQLLMNGSGGASNAAAGYFEAQTGSSSPAWLVMDGVRSNAMAYVTTSTVNAFNASAWGNGTAGQTLTIAKGLNIESPTTTGTVTTAYGIYLNSITGAGTNYAIYSAGGNNYLAGNLGIADTTPSNALTVTGVGSLTSYLQVGSETATTYSRFGTGTTDHSLSGAADLLLSDDLEVDGQIYADGITSGTPSGSVCYDSSNKLIQCSGSHSISGSGTSGQIAFFNGTNSITSETSGFGWDTTNKLFTLTSTASTQTPFALTANSLSSGSAFDITVNSTAAASNTQKGLNITLSGANGTSTQTTYGGYITNIHTGTSSTNVGLYASASGGSNNYAAIFNAGNVGIGTVTPEALLHVSGGSILLDNNQPLQAKNTSGTAKNIMYIDTSNNLNIGSNIAGSGSQTNIFASGSNGVQFSNSDSTNLLLINASSSYAQFSPASTKGFTFTSITSAPSDFFTVGANGKTNPAFQIDASAASIATGLKITGAAAGSGLALSTISSGTDENLTIDAKGAGTITLGATSTGIIAINRDVNFLKEVARTIQIADSTTSNTAGAALTIKGAAGAATNAAGGAINLTTGAGAGSGAGGTLALAGGAAGSTGIGGAITLTGGNGGSTSGAGGAITLTAGSANTSSGTSTGGAINIISGNGARYGSSGTGGIGGAINITAGSTGGDGNTNGAAIAITAGTATQNGTGGAITLTSGGASNGGTTGAITITSAGSTGNGAPTGAVNFRSGNGHNEAGGGGSGGASGAVNIFSGAGGTTINGTGGNAGTVAITGGNGGGGSSTTGGNGGSLTLTAGNGGAGSSTGGNAGAISITSGNGYLAKAGGALTLTSGAGGATGTGGAISLTTGAGGSSSGGSGDLTLNTGSVTSGTAGTINIGTSNTPTINFGDGTQTITIDIGGVTSSNASTINIATNSTAADTISIGNSNSSTTLALTGGDDWSITSAGLASFGSILQVGSATATTYSRFGTGTTGHSLSAASSLLVSGDLEVDGTLYMDGNFSQTGSTTFSTGTGTISLNGDTTVASGKTLTLTGTEGSNIFTLTAGDAVISDGSLAITDDDNATSFSVTNNTATTGTVANVTSTSLTTGSLLKVTPGDPSSSLTGKLVDVSSTNHSYLALTNQDLSVGGHKTIQSYTSSMTGAFVYDTTNDSDGGRWTDDDRAKSSSWYNESAGSTRSSTKAFPRKAFIVAGATSVSIYDGKDNTLWMQFGKGLTTTVQMIGQTTNSSVTSVFALNGKLYVGTSTTEGLFVIDFKKDISYQYNTTNDFIGNKNIANRNTTVSYAMTGPSSPIPSNTVNDVHGAVVKGKTYIALANGNSLGVSVINETDNTVVSSSDDASTFNKVFMLSNGNLYFARGARMGAAYDVTSLSAGWSASYRQYIYSSTPSSSTGPYIGTSGFLSQDLFVTTGTSTVDGKSNTIYLSTNGQLNAIQEKQGDENNGSIKYYNSTYVTEEMIGSTRIMIPGTDTSGNLTDASTMGNTLTATGLSYSNNSGVRGTAVNLDTNTDNATSTASTILISATNTGPSSSGAGLSVSAWVNPASLTTTNGTAEMWVSADANVASKVSWGIGTKGDGTSANITCSVNGSTGYTELNSGIAAATSTWYHVVLTSDTSGNLTCYVNGQSKATGSVSGTAETPTRFQIGATQATTALNSVVGLVDEVTVTSDKLTASQVQNMYFVGYRALQNHTARAFGVDSNTYTITADNFQKFNGSSSNIKGGRVFLEKGAIYAGTQGGGVSVFGIDSDSVIDLYYYSAADSYTNIDDTGTVLDSNTNGNNINFLSVSKGYGTGISLLIGNSSAANTKAWIETSTTQIKEFMASSYNPFGKTLNQNQINVDGVFQIMNQLSSRIDNLSLNSTTEPYIYPAFSLDNAGNMLWQPSNTTGTSGTWNVATTTGTGLDANFNAVTTGTGLNVDANALTTGTGFAVASTGTIITTGELVSLTANSLTTGAVLRISATGLTSGTGIEYTGSTSVGITGNVISLASDIGSAGELINLTPDFSGSAVTGQAITIAATDSTSNANTDYGINSTLTLTGNAAKVGVGSLLTVTSSSTTGDTLIAEDLVTSATGALGATTRTNIGLRTKPASTAATSNASGVLNLYGVDSEPSSTLATAGTTNVYGTYIKSTATHAADAGTINNYGVYVDNGTSSTNGTSAKYGIYVAAQSGADTNYALYTAGGTVQFTCTTSGTTWTTSQSNPSCSDYAEVYDTDDLTLEAGDIITLDTVTGGKVGKSTDAYQKTVIGIYSTSPGMLIGPQGIISAAGENMNLGEGKVPVALTGRVPLKVSTENGSIEVGDYLTSSSIPGVAMKATHPGQMIGKAMESYSGSGVNKILVFVNVTYADPGNFFASLTVNDQGDLIMPAIKTANLKINTNVNLAKANNKGLLAFNTTTTNGQASYEVDVLSSLKNIEDKVIQVDDNQIIASGNITQIQDKIATQSSALAELVSRIKSLESSSSANYNLATQQSNNLNLTAPDIMIATESALLADLKVTSQATFSGMLAAYDLNVSNNFKSFGETSLGNTTIAGNLIVDGTFSISQESIDVIKASSCVNAKDPGCGILYLQKSPLAQGLDIFDGKVFIDNSGAIKAQVIAVAEFKALANKSTGSGKISSGHSSVEITTSLVNAKSRILVTPTTNSLLNIAVTQKTEGEKFTVSTPVVSSEDITFDWFLVNEYE